MPNEKIIRFPWIFPGNKLNGNEYTHNSINGGFKTIADFNIQKNTFFGGNVDKLGLVKELGIYICPDRWNNQVRGFYVHQFEDVTAEGWKALKATYPNLTFLPGVEKAPELTKEDIEKRATYRTMALEAGMKPDQVDHLNANELLAALATLEHGQAQKQAAVVEDAPIRKAIEDKVVQERPSITAKGGKSYSL